MKEWEKYDVVMCNQSYFGAEGNVISCMALYAHKDPKHQGPCHYCYERIKNAAAFKVKLDKMAGDPELTEYDREDLDKDRNFKE